MTLQTPNQRFDELNKELARREREALRCYRPMQGDQENFHRSKAYELLLRGGKRSGKTIGAACEFASRILGQPIMDSQGNIIPLRWPVSTKDDPKLYFIIGWDVKHIGQTLFKRLFKPNLFRVIRDLHTGQWRAYNEVFDLDRYKESKPADALIPERMIRPDKWDWENKAGNHFNSVELTNGAVICAFPSSQRNAKQGDAVSGIWIDEDIQIPTHLQEWQDRLTTTDGWFLWSVWPHEKNIALEKLVSRADECQDQEEPIIQAFSLSMTGNVFYPEKHKQHALARMEDDEEIARRDRGELLWETTQMYPMNAAVHVVSPFPSGVYITDPTNGIDVIRKILSDKGKLPREFTRYVSIDPSHTRTAVMFGVIPPPELVYGNLLIIERELVMKRATPDILAWALKELMQGYVYEAFIMDQQMGRQTRVGNDTTVFEAYAAAFAREGINARITGSNFIPGVNVPTVRYRAVRELLSTSKTGVPSLILLADTTRETQKEFGHYRKKKSIIANEEIIYDEPSNPRKYDCMAALEYLVAHIEPLFKRGAAYIPPEMYSAPSNGIRQAADEMFGKKEGYVHLGPGVAA